MPKRDFLQRQPIEEEEEMMQPKRDVVQRISPADEDELPSNAPASGPSNASGAGSASAPSNTSPASSSSNASGPEQRICSQCFWAK